MSKATAAIERVVRPALDKVVEHRYEPAAALVESLRLEMGSPSTEALVDAIVKRYTRELVAVAAVTGGAAAIPGAGTGTAIATSGIDLAYSMTKLGEMILAIGVAYGHSARSIEERRTHVLSVLAMANGVASGIEGVAGKVGSVGGASLVAKIPDEALLNINKRLGAKVLAKLATEQGAIRLGKLIPFGIGAGVGAVGSAVLTRSVAKQARKFFGQQSSDADDPNNGRRQVIDVVEVPATRRSV